MNEIQLAFIDEYGNYGFDFDNHDNSTHFIIVSILVKESEKENLEQQLQNYFSSESGPMDDAQKFKVLQEIKDLPFSIYAYVIDKRKVREDSGIMHQTPFIKYVNRMVYEDLNRTFDQLDLVADEAEGKKFLQEFKKYIMTRSIPDLFNYSSFGFNNSHSEILLKLSGLIAETLGNSYDRSSYSVHSHLLLKIIKHKIAALNLLPLDYRHFLYDYKTDPADSRYNEVIIKQAVNSAYQYIEKHRKSEEEDERLRIDFLKFLLFNLKENPDEYVYTQEILDNLNAIRDVKMNQHYFRSNIVSKLRDSGLLIASSNKGYKLPVSLNDLYDFVNLSSLTIYPMLQRISKCRDQILLATNQEIDILDPKEYGYLKKIIEMEKLKAQ